MTTILNPGLDASPNGNNWTTNNISLQTNTLAYTGGDISGMFNGNPSTGGTPGGITGTFVTPLSYNTLLVIYGNMANGALGNPASGATLSINGSTVSATGTYSDYGWNPSYTKYYTTSTPGTLTSIGISPDVSGSYGAALYKLWIDGVLIAYNAYDSMNDVPTLTSETQANYAVLNPLDNSGTLTNGNLTLTSTSGNQASRATIQLPSSGKFYAECTLGTTTASTVGEAFGFALSTSPLTTSPNVAGEYKYLIYADSTGGIYSNGTTLTSSLGAFSAGTVLQIAYDGATGNAWVGKDNTWYNSSGGTTGDPATGANPTFTSLTNVFPFVQGAAAGTNPIQFVNFGQQPFVYTPPTNFVALNTYNL